MVCIVYNHSKYPTLRRFIFAETMLTQRVHFKGVALIMLRLVMLESNSVICKISHAQSIGQINIILGLATMPTSTEQKLLTSFSFYHCFSLRFTSYIYFYMFLYPHYFPLRIRVTDYIYFCMFSISALLNFTYLN